jgi:hypothetical protein
LRKRRWVIFIFAAICIVALLTLFAHKIFQTNERIKEFVLAQVRPLVGDELEIAHVHLSLSTIHFFGVHMPLQESKFILNIKDVRVGYNLFKALSTRFSPQSFSQDLLLVNPKFIITSKDSTIFQNEKNDVKEGLFDIPNANQLKNLKYINRLSIQDGEIVFIRPDQNYINIGTSLGGWIFTQNNDSMSIRLEGKLFESKSNNLFIDGTVDLAQNVLEKVNINFQNYALDNFLPEIIPDFIEIGDGAADGKLVLSSNNTNALEYDLQGEIDIHGFNAKMWDGKLNIVDLNLECSLTNWNVVIDTCSLYLNQSLGIINGSVNNILNPVLDIGYHFSDISFSQFAEQFGAEKLKYSGTGNLQGSYKGPLNDPYLRYNFNSKLVKYDNLKFENVYLTSSYHKSKIVVGELAGSIVNNKVVFKGKVAKQDSNFNITGDVRAEGNIKSLVQPYIDADIDTCATWLNAQVSGAVNNPILYGSLGADLVPHNQDTLKFRNAFSFFNRKFLSIPTEKNNGPTLTATFDFNEDPLRFTFQAKRTENILSTLWDFPGKNLLSKYTLDVFGDGSQNDFNIYNRIGQRNAELGLTEFATIESEFHVQDESFSGTGKLEFLPGSEKTVMGNFKFIKNNDSFNLEQFSLGNNLNLQLYLKDSTSLSGLLETNSFDPTFLFDMPDSLLKGKITSKIQIVGSAKHPQANGYFELTNGFINDQGPYSGLLDFVYDSSAFVLDNLNLVKDSSEIFYASGKSDKQFQNLDFNLKGTEFDLQTIASSLYQNSSFLKGASDIDVKISGSYKNPIIGGMLRIKDGALFQFPFDQFEVILGDKDIRNDVMQVQQQRPGLFVNEFKMTRKNEFDLIGHGFYPYKSNDSLSLAMSGQGNFFAILPDLTDFFKATNSTGTLAIDLGGTRSNPTIKNASLKLNKGDIKFGSVIPEITDSNLEIHFDPENRFVHVQSFNGLIGGQEFEITSGLAEHDSNKSNLGNFTFGSSALNLGVFELKSGESGIPLNIPGLMEKNDFGRFVVSGKTQTDGFYFAGPTNRPQLQGQLKIFDNRIMFPFAEGAGEPDEVIEELLNSMQWDIAVTPGQDVRYIRSFPGAIDNVYVNMLLDEEYSELLFLGQRRDESFRINGQISSTTGLIEYLDMTFRIERAGAEFDNSSLIPVVFGKARTTITDSVGVPTQIMLTAQTVDQTMEKKRVEDRVRDEKSRGRLDQIRFRLSSDNPNLGNSETQILATLGYAAKSFQGTAFDAIGFGTDNILFRPIFRPVERRLEAVFGLDYVRFNSRLASNIIDFNLNSNLELNTRLALLRSTRIVVGKFLASNLFFQYTGQVQAGIDYRYKEKGLGLTHKLGFEYHINPKLLLEIEYNYDTLMRYNQEDKRIMLRHWFPF